MTQTIETSNRPYAFDQAMADAFVGKVFGDTVGLATTAMASIGDPLGLFKDLAKNATGTGVELAARTGTHERYEREWPGAMANAGDLEYDPASAQFTLPPEHVPVLAQEAGPVFFGGLHEEMIGTLQSFENSWVTSGRAAGSTWTTTPTRCSKASTDSPPAGSRTS